MARVTVDNTKNLYPGTTTIADLAQYCPMFKENKSEDLNIYQVEDMMTREYKNEIEKFEYEYATGYTAYFKDGSVLSVGAWADCHNPEAIYESYKEPVRGYDYF